MHQTDCFYLANVDALIEAVQAREPEMIDLDYVSRGVADLECNCLAGLVARLPYFHAYGVVRGDGGAPEMLGADGLPRLVDETLAHLFGPFGTGGSAQILFGCYGTGLFDSALRLRASGDMSHKDLALGRLFLVRGVLASEAVPGQCRAIAG